MTGTRKLLLLSILSASYCVGGKDSDWQTGKVFDSQLDRKHTRGDTCLWIVGEAYAYLVVKPSDSKWHGMMAIAKKRNCQLVAGDDIQYAQEKVTLYVRDANGNRCKLAIVRGEQLQR